MAIPVKFYRFSKKENSTKRPGNADKTYTCTIKSESGVINPRISLNIPLTENPTIYNYAFISEYDRYYYVADWQWTAGLWTAILSIDYLASWKDTIGSSSFYVLRSSATFDKTVTDAIYPASTTVTVNTVWQQFDDWSELPTLGRGTYVVGLINDSSSDWGTIAYYALSPSQMSSIRQFMLAGATDWSTIGSDLDASLLKSFVDPFSYVVSCKWFPVTISGGQEENVKFGFWDSGVKARKLSSLMNRKEFTLARPDIPGIERGDWVGKSPFTSYHVQCIPWGVIPIDSTDITADGVVVVRLIDYVTGLGTLAIYKRIAGQGETQYNEQGGLLNIVETQVGIDVRLSQLSYDITVPTSLTELVSGAAAAAFSTAYAAADSAIGKNAGIASGISAANSSGKQVGEQGGYAQNSLAGTIALVAKTFTPVADNNAEQGKPLCATRTISDIPGFVKVQDGDVQMFGTMTEKVAVKNYLEGGFFYE